jgi:hypothetical protein
MHVFTVFWLAWRMVLQRVALLLLLLQYGHRRLQAA